MQVLNPKVIKELKKYFGKEGRTVSYLTKHVQVDGVKPRQIKYTRKRMVEKGILKQIGGGTSDAIFAVNKNYEPDDKAS